MNCNKCNPAAPTLWRNQYSGSTEEGNGLHRSEVILTSRATEYTGQNFGINADKKVASSGEATSIASFVVLPGLSSTP